MIQAGQRALFQAQNKEVLSIRQSEMDYFHNFYSNFGTQSALIVGFCLNTLTQLVGQVGDSDVTKDIFFVFSALCFIFSMNCLVGSVFIVVFAPNLALHGPLGSMVRAVDGMLYEQDQIFLSFILALVSFTISTTMAYWILMDNTIATVCTALTVIAGGVWYHFCLRIYNRFKMHVNSEKAFEDDISKDYTSRKMRFAWAGNSKKRKQQQQASSLKAPLIDKKTGDKSVGEGASDTDWGKPAGGSQATREEVEDANEPAFVPSLSMISNVSEMFGVEGYMTFRLIRAAATEDRRRSADGSQQRKYFVMFDGELNYYASYRAYHEHPEQAESSRPVMVSEYNVIVSTKVSPYVIVLQPLEEERASFEFQLDTIDELRAWQEGFMNQNAINCSEQDT